MSSSWLRRDWSPAYLMGTGPSVDTLPPLRARRLDWAALLARVWAVDVLRCPRCDGKMRVIAALSDPTVVARVLAHLDLPTALPCPAPARAPPWSEDELNQGELDLDDDLEWTDDAALEWDEAIG
jgi:hypothetical protein